MRRRCHLVRFPLPLLDRYWRLGGEHQARARERVLNEVFSHLPDFDARWAAADKTDKWKQLAWTTAEICVGLSSADALFVSAAFRC